ncbi:TIR domain-containing protein [Streptomyces ferrugineus]|uniref:TIR domain-containing protein n=1 Tax=Streptomyces ferrugineus TaxID=1413221 RepID=A0A7M2SB32_9ACTN|nr:TIR-like protein FxsC [Streptomyces ferrugineus]QOV33514.1 TIR domain-containing protein [Streptomyces ferrugineus]
MEPYFFLSYARRRGPRVLIKRFYDDLCTELRGLRARTSEPFGRPFLDVLSIQVGQNWNAALGDAVGHCRTMVALYTSDYFRSDFCGREWKAFDDRQRGLRDVTGVDARALIPVLWEPVSGVPTGADHIQYENIDFGEDYARWGLRRLLVADPGGEYIRIVKLLAQQILVAAEHFRIPVVEGLDLSAPEAVGPFPSTDLAAPGSHALVLVAARTAATAHPQRVHPACRCHGDSPADWNPFPTEHEEPLATRARRLLEQSGFTVRTETVSHQLGQHLDRARAQGWVAVLLVEAQAAADEAYRRAIRAYDRENHPGSVVIVPCGADEASDPSQGKSYWDTVRSAFPLSWASGAGEPLPLVQLGALSDDFDGLLHAVVAKASNHLFSFLGEEEVFPTDSASLPILDVVAPFRPTPSRAGARSRTDDP